jgi:hypothetical protein
MGLGRTLIRWILTALLGVGAGAIAYYGESVALGIVEVLLGLAMAVLVAIMVLGKRSR